MSTTLRGVLGIVLSAAGLLMSPGAFAAYELYKDGDTKLDLNLMVAGAQIGQDQSWFGEAHTFLNESQSHWSEFGTEFGLTGEMTLGGGTLFAEASGVYTRTSGDDASGITAGLSEEEDTTLEQGNLGWKMSDPFAALDEDVLTFEIGRFDYSIGTGMLIVDGGSDGGHRGGWYLGMRKAFQNAAIIKLDSTTWKAQVFHLKNNPRRGGNQGEANGVNVDYAFGEDLSVGASYMRIDPQQNNIDSADIYDGRASWTVLPGLTLSGEYARENIDQIEANGYYAQAKYEFGAMQWKPTFTYRYADFNENFNGIAYGYTDYGYWFQGEIAGNYPLSNTNLKSNMVRANVTPREGIVINVFYWDFKLADAGAFGVASDDLGEEVDLIVDWQATERVYVIAELAQWNPGDGATQLTGGDKDWKYALVTVSFTL